MISPHIFWLDQPHIKQTSLLTKLGFWEVWLWMIFQRITLIESPPTITLPTVVPALLSGTDSNVFHAVIQLQFSTLPLESVMFVPMELFMTVLLIHANKEDLKITSPTLPVNHIFWFLLKLKKVPWINTWTLENNHVQKLLHSSRITTVSHVLKTSHISTFFQKNVKLALTNTSSMKALTHVFKELQMPLMFQLTLQDWWWMMTQPMKIGTTMLKKMRTKFSVQVTNHFGLEKNVFNVQLYSTLSQENVWNVKKDLPFTLTLINVNQLNHSNLISSICSTLSFDHLYSGSMYSNFNFFYWYLNKKIKKIGKLVVLDLFSCLNLRSLLILFINLFLDFEWLCFSFNKLSSL